MSVLAMTLSVAARRPILFRCASPRTPSAACCPPGCEFRRSGIFQVVKMAGNDWPDWLCFSPQIKTSPQVWGRGWRQRQHRVGLEPSGGKRTRWPGEINARVGKIYLPCWRKTLWFGRSLLRLTHPRSGEKLWNHLRFPPQPIDYRSK